MTPKKKWGHYHCHSGRPDADEMIAHQQFSDSGLVSLGVSIYVTPQMVIKLVTTSLNLLTRLEQLSTGAIISGGR